MCTDVKNTVFFVELKKVICIMFETNNILIQYNLFADALYSALDDPRADLPNPRRDQSKNFQFLGPVH